VDVGEEDFGEELFDDTEVGKAAKKPMKGTVGKPVKKKIPTKGKLPERKVTEPTKKSTASKEDILKPDIDDAKRGPGKPYLHKINKIVKCNICLGNIKGGLTTLTCICGKHYHENCAKRVATCPVCETNLNEPVDTNESDDWD
jgi:hypothetical protein